MDRRAFLAACVMPSLAGCAAFGISASVPPGRPPRALIRRFGLLGRLAVRNGDASYFANIEWRHVADGGEYLLVTSPLGQGVAELGADGRGAWIRTAERQRYDAATLDDLSEQVFGARLPLSHLPLWALARTVDPASVARLVLDGLGRPESFVEAGWQISYPSYESRSREALPSAMRFARDPLDVRLKVDEWNLLP